MSISIADNSIYILDANVFIQAARQYYAFDIAPKFWDSLLHYAENEQIRSIDKVKQELDQGAKMLKNGTNDDLKTWLNDSFVQYFVSTDQDIVIKSFSEIIQWVQSQSQFSDFAKAEFANGADGWLVAFAKVNSFILVTQEVYVPNVRRRVPIPNVCQEFRVPYIDTFRMLRNLGVKFS